MNLFKYKAVPIELAEKLGLCKKHESIWKRIKNFFLKKERRVPKISKIELVERLSDEILEGYIEAASFELAIIKLSNELRLFPVSLESLKNKESKNALRLMNLLKLRHDLSK